jgi:hypothetical protein
MFSEAAKATYANFGLATIVRNKLVRNDPDAVYDLVRVPTGVQIVRSTPIAPALVVPEAKPQVAPVVVDETVKFVVRIRSMSDKWITLFEPMPNGGTVWVYRPHVSAINRLSDSHDCELVVPSKIAKKKGWAA